MYSQHLVMTLICSVLFLSSAIYQVDLVISHFRLVERVEQISTCMYFQQLKHPDYYLIILLAAILVSSSNLFIYCYFGRLATQSFEKMADYLFETNWSVRPVGLQKYFILMLQNMQRPIHYHGSGIAVLHLETFTSVKSFVLIHYYLLV